MIKMNPWLVCSKPNTQAHLRLFCFPYAGGGASIFRAWSGDLPASIEVCSIQLPGREDRVREPSFTRIEPLVHNLAQALRPHLDKPFAFFGHSMGALIGFELAHALIRQYGLSPVHLFASGHAAPQLNRTTPPIHQLPKRELIAELARLKGTPLQVLQSPDVMDFFLPMLRADLAIGETYVYTPRRPLDCPISVFGGLQDSITCQNSLPAWRDQTQSTFKLHLVPGDHFFLHTTRAQLLRILVQDLGPFLCSTSVDVIGPAGNGQRVSTHALE